MKKVINIEPSEVFKMLTEGKTVYCVLGTNNQILNMRYVHVETLVDLLKGENRTFFVVDEETET